MTKSAAVIIACYHDWSERLHGLWMAGWCIYRGRTGAAPNRTDDIYELLPFSFDNENSSDGGRKSSEKTLEHIVRRKTLTCSIKWLFFFYHRHRSSVTPSATSLDPVSCEAKLFLCLIFYLPSRRQRPSRSHTTPSHLRARR